MHRFVSNPSTRSHRSSLSSPPSPSEGKLEGRNHAVPAWCNLIRKDGKSAARIGASNVNTCRLDIFVTSKDSDRNRGNRRYARETPHHGSRISAEYVSGYWLYIFIEFVERHRSFVSSSPLLLSRRWSSSRTSSLVAPPV